MKKIKHLPRYAITGDAWDTLQHEITRLMRSPSVAERLNPLEDAAVLEYQRSRIADHVALAGDSAGDDDARRGRG